MAPQERFPRPALKLPELSVQRIPESDELAASIAQNYYQYLNKRKGELCSVEELQQFHQGLPTAKTATLSAILNGLTILRTQVLPEKEDQKVVTVCSRSERMYGVVLLPKNKKNTSLSQIGVSVFRDEPAGGLRVIPWLSVLSKEKLEQNPWADTKAVVSLFDALGEENEKIHLQSPFLTPTQRRLIAILAEHPEGVSIRELLSSGLGIEDIGKDEIRLLRTHLLSSRPKLGSLQIYHTPTQLKLEETRYVLMNKQPIGKEIHFPIIGDEEVAFLPEPAREVVEDLCNLLEVHSEAELRCSLAAMQRRLLVYLAHNYGSPCSVRHLIIDVLPHVRYPPSYIGRVRALKTGLQEALEGSEGCKLRIFTVFEYSDERGAAYVLLEKDHFQGKNRGKIDLIHPREFIGVDESIYASIQEMVNGVKIKGKKGLELRPILGKKERDLLLILAKSFPEGCESRVLSEMLFANSMHPIRTLNFFIIKLRKKINKEFKDIRDDEYPVLTVFTLRGACKEKEGVYALLPRTHFQDKEKGKFLVVDEEGLAGVNEEIRSSIEKVCNQVRVKGVNLRTVVTPRERAILLALARSFPLGLDGERLINLFPDSKNPYKNLNGHLFRVGRKFLEEFGEDKFSIKYERASGQYRLVVAEE